MASLEESGPIFGTPEHALAILDREVEAYTDFDALCQELVVRRKVRHRSQPGIPPSLTTVYEPVPLSVDAKEWGQPTVALAIAKRETVPPDRLLEAEFAGDDYLVQASERYVEPRLAVLNSICDNRSKTVLRFTRPLVDLRFNDIGLLVPQMVDPSFVMADRALVEMEQEHYLHWLGSLVAQRLS